MESSRSGASLDPSTGGFASRSASSRSTAWTSAAYFGGIAVARARFSATVFVCLAVFGLGAIPLASSPALAVATAASVGVLAATTAALLLSPRRERERESAGALADALVALGLVASVPLMYALDFNGPIVGVILMLLVLNNFAARPAWGVGTTLTTWALHLALQYLSVSGVVPRATLLQVEMQRRSGIALSVLVTNTLLYVLAFSIPYLFSRRTGKHLEELAEAGREIAAREALLREARLELDRAVEIGRRGRFTEQELGSFVLGNVLGRGGMGEIYEATHAASGERAAVKLLRVVSGESSDVVPRFLRESAIALALESPHIVKILEVGGMEAPLPYIAMERLEGEDLGAILRRRGRIEPDEVVAMVRQIAEGLAVARARGVVHRDIKPNNLFLDTRAGGAVWKVLDFGVARAGAQSGTLTGAGLVGTLGFLAPEQLDGANEIDHRADLHALGAVAYRALTGRPAFVEREPAGVLREVQGRLPARPSTVVSIPLAVDDVLRVALAKSPADRFDDARAFAEALAKAVTGAIDPELARRAEELGRKVPWRDEAPASIRNMIAARRRRRGAPSVRTMTVAPAAASAEAPSAAAAPSPEVAETATVALPQEGPVAAAPAARDAIAAADRITLVGDEEDVVRSMRVARVRAVLPALIAVAVFGFTQLPLNRDPTMRPFGVAVLLVLLVEMAGVILLARRDTPEITRRYNQLACVGFATASLMIYYFQIHGIVPAFLGVALLMFSLSASTATALAAVLCVAIPHVAMVLFVTFSGVRYEGVFVVHAGVAGRLWNLAHSLGVYAIAFVLGRIFNDRSRRTLRALGEALRKLSEREALLRDARLELERAVGVGQPGRFTGQVFGRFRLGTVLGRGGMGEVYDATADDGRPAAVKLLRPAPGADPAGAVRRFEQEARIASSLESPNVVRVLEIGAMTADAPPYLAMERLDGADLSSLLQQSLLLSPSMVVEMAEQVGAALDVAHAAGVVHRDLKPHNVFRTRAGVWKLMDFGVASLGREDTAALQRGLAGTPAYMAPEQLAKGEPVDGRADVYALGVVVYRALTGRPAFSGRDTNAVIERVLRGEPEPPSAIAPVPPAVDAVLARAMARRPDDRFATASALAGALRSALGAA